MARIACIGHTTLDIILMLESGHLQQIDQPQQEYCLPFPSKTYVKNKVVSLGGNAPNAGAGLMKLGHQVKLISQVGDDEIGSVITKFLKKLKFNLTYSPCQGVSDTSVILSYGGDRTILSYHADTAYPFPQELTGIDWVYLSSLGFQRFADFHAHLINWLNQNPEVRTVYNPGLPEIDAGCEKLQAIFRKIHTLILNKEEAAVMLGCAPVTSDNRAGITHMLTLFTQQGLPQVIITDGRRGAYFTQSADQFDHIPAFGGTAVDTTGAGDAFSSGYLGAVAHGWPPLDALKAAALQSAHVITQAGATNGLIDMPTIEQLLQQNPNFVPAIITNIS